MKSISQEMNEAKITIMRSSLRDNKVPMLSMYGIIYGTVVVLLSCCPLLVTVAYGSLSLLPGTLFLSLSVLEHCLVTVSLYQCLSLLKGFVIGHCQSV